MQAALHGVGTVGATAYCTHSPCSNCTKLLISAGIERIVFETNYLDDVAAQLLEEAGIRIEAYPVADSITR